MTRSPAAPAGTGTAGASGRPDAPGPDDPVPDAPAAPAGGPRAHEQEGLARFAGFWARVIYPFTATSMTRDELERHLLPLATRLRSLLDEDLLDASPAQEVGRGLVQAHCTDPQVLAQSLTVIEACLLLYRPASPDIPSDVVRSRLSRLQAAVAAGFARALRDRTRHEQEAITRAALTAHQRSQRALHESEAKFRALFEGLAVGIGVGDLQGRIVDVNDALVSMFDSTPEDMRKMRVDDLVHPDDLPGVWDLYQQLIRGERDRFVMEKPYFRSDGSVLWTDLRVSLIRDEEGRPQYQVAMLEDVTERKQINDRLRHQATHDPLTGLGNRVLFLERLEEVFAHEGGGRRVGVCYLDLDGFKAVNDSLGHATGDRLLVAVAERLTGCLRGPHQSVARMGGDEFTALVVDPAGPHEVTELARRFLAALAAPVHIDGRDLSVNVSIGVVESSTDGTTAARMVQSADISLYRAKARGGNCYAMHDPEADAREMSRYHLSTRMPEALESGEFFLEYQPMVSLADGSLKGVEALVRWRHPEHGVLGPDRFVPLAEETGLIVPLGRWVLEQACSQARRWQREFPDCAPRVNVNLSVHQVRSPGLVQDVARVLKNCELEPGALQLEVTESAVVGADDQALTALRELTDMGVGLALDDFGTGYSNFAGLRRLPVQTLKIDRSFISGLRGAEGGDPRDEQVLAGVLSLARTLELAVTVEGVETEEQAERLRSLSVQSAQGWHFARPGPADAITRALRG
ncbi:EAL domain-containing protein [Streptomyces sp. SCUT-3]|uniref:putative bifunctional diguanylate cyclase/phosphodiesterase n=1 Tax=Streptomyces sp. SCUT-3 TaxID=2684469 RepID=UPI0026A5908E